MGSLPVLSPPECAPPPHPTPAPPEGTRATVAASVEFPYKPYGTQLAFTGRVIATLDRGRRQGRSKHAPGREGAREMVGNDWINSYLEAILDAGGTTGDFSASAAGGADGQGAGSAVEKKRRDKASLMLRERGRFNPSRYFVEEVISGFDETDLYKTWVRTSAMRSLQERNTRLENMSWRIWNLARKKKQELAQRAVGRHRRAQLAAARLCRHLPASLLPICSARAHLRGCVATASPARRRAVASPARRRLLLCGDQLDAHLLHVLWRPHRHAAPVPSRCGPRTHPLPASSHPRPPMRDLGKSLAAASFYSRRDPLQTLMLLLLLLDDTDAP